MVQQITHRSGSASDPTYVVALKQLYASHYFQSALDLTVCIKDAARTNEHGFYLITVKGSQQAGLTGLKGSMVRKVAVGKTRSPRNPLFLSVFVSLWFVTVVAVILFCSFLGRISYLKRRCQYFEAT
jgi:hypothetical protein